MFTEKQKKEILLDFLGPSGDGLSPLCPACGEALTIRTSVSKVSGLQLDVVCTGCRSDFSWAQPQPSRYWKGLYLEYFLECYRQGRPARCPYDDCYVSSAEFSDAVVQFNCPYCNRRGQIGATGPG